MGQAILDLKNNFKASFGPEGSISKQLNNIEQVLVTIAVNVKR